MGLGSFLGNLIAPGSADKQNDASAAIGATLSGSSPYWQTGNMGLQGGQGAGIAQQAANIAATPVAANTTAMDADAAKAGQLAALYQSLFAGGGLAEAAAAQTANADLAQGQGGAAGIAQQMANSRAAMGRTSQVGTAERAQNGGEANAVDFQVAAANLAKASMQAQASHATHLNAMQSQAIQNYMANQQVANDQSLFEAASNARGGQANINQQVSNANFKTGMQLGTAALAGVGGAAALGTGMLGQSAAAASPTLAQQVAQAQMLQLTQPSASLKLAQTPSPFYPGTLSNTYPTTPNAWALPSSAAVYP